MKGIGIWKLPVAKDEAHKKWQDRWLSEMTKMCEIDHDFLLMLKQSFHNFHIFLGCPGSPLKLKAPTLALTLARTPEFPV